MWRQWVMTSHATLTTALDQFFHRVAMRMHATWAMRGAAIGGMITALWSARALLRPTGAGHTIAASVPSWLEALVLVSAGMAVGAVIAALWSHSRRARVVREVEQREPTSRNLLATATELDAARTSVAVQQLVLRRAVHHAQSLDLTQLVPFRHSALVLAASMVVAMIAIAAGRRTQSGAAPRAVSSLVARLTGSIDVGDLVVAVQSPSYAGITSRALRNPVRVDALAGSRLIISVTSTADSLVVITRSGTDTVLSSNVTGTFRWTMTANEDGFVSLEPRAMSGRAGTRRLVAITVRSDDQPRVRIVDPTKDLILSDARRTLAVRIDANDDLAIGSLRLRYTRVSGSGERFTFDEGEIPVAVTRTSRTEWAARATLALEPLLKEAGDLVVYRAVVTDTRPGSAPVESDALIAELASPGGIAALGFSLDPDEDRYGLSQQMVILKTEKLLARTASMSAAAVQEEAMQVAAEQQRVRAEFVFMMGGEFAQEVGVDNSMGDLDETHEAESESDLSAGRMANRGRTSLLAAVRAMSRASTALNSSNIASALVSEKTALTQLQNAFARSRFLMRALSQREQLDMSRRLSGRLDSIARTRAPIPEGERSARVAGLRPILSDLVNLTGADSANSAMLVQLAERVLQVDASSSDARRVAALLSSAAAARGLARRAHVDSAATALNALLRHDLRLIPLDLAPDALRRLQQALTGTSGKRL